MPSGKNLHPHSHLSSSHLFEVLTPLIWWWQGGEVGVSGCCGDEEDRSSGRESGNGGEAEDSESGSDSGWRQQ